MVLKKGINVYNQKFTSNKLFDFEKFKQLFKIFFFCNKIQDKPKKQHVLPVR